MDETVTTVPSNYLNAIEDAADGLHCLLEELRNYSAPIQLDLNNWDLPSVWRKSWADLVVERGSKHIELRETAVETLQLNCCLDRMRFEQVFRNIFGNSIAACDRETIVEVCCSEELYGGEQWLSIVIRDNGPGMNQEQATRLFEAFFTTKHKGTGLGMAIVRRLVEAHRGRIDVIEIDRPGTAIQILLPRQVD